MNLKLLSASLAIAIAAVCAQNDEDTCNICGPGGMIGSRNGVVSLYGNNQTCGQLQDRADDGLISADQCDELIPLAQNPCECTTFVCDICDGGDISNPSGLIDVPGDDEGLITCAQANSNAEAGGYDEEVCPEIQDVASGPCGCQNDSPTVAPRSTPQPTPRPTRAPVSAPVSAPAQEPQPGPPASHGTLTSLSLAAALLQVAAVFIL